MSSRSLGVYPRERGGTSSCRSASASVRGLSPRTRGNRCWRWWCWRCRGSIPANAGEPPRLSVTVPASRVYPRERGGTIAPVQRQGDPEGLSPRTRGNRVLGAVRVPPRGSIPANAGEPLSLSGLDRRRGVYPRERGGTDVFDGLDSLQSGLSPRTRGNRVRVRRLARTPGSIPANAGEPSRGWTPWGDCGVYPRERGGTAQGGSGRLGAAGLSPRTRGNRPVLPRPATPVGSIPANAGEPRAAARSRRARRVYPRERGGTDALTNFVATGEGLSPRTRGNLRDAPVARRRIGSIPANAGEPITTERGRCGSEVYPRERGGTALAAIVRQQARGLSPRTRGNPARGYAVVLRCGSIPANAGEPSSIVFPPVSSSVYPRERGGTRASPTGKTRRTGLSPRTRGNRWYPSWAVSKVGSIPANAGEPINRA